MSRFSIVRLARVSAERPWRVVGLWLVLLLIAGALSSSLEDGLTTEATFSTNPESMQGADLLEERLRGPAPMTETVIVRSESMTVDDPVFQAEIEGITAELTALSGTVASATNYVQTGNEGLVSADRHTTLVPVTLGGNFDDAVEQAPGVIAVIDAANQRANGAFEFLTVGEGSINHELNEISNEDAAAGEAIGVPVALLILILVFGALVAAGLPLALGVISIVVAIGIAAIVGRFFELSFLVTNMISIIGLAVGIDYSLFVVERFREERRQGLTTLDAIATAAGAASRAVVFSGLTVILSLLGLFLVPSNIFRSVSIGAVAVVTVAVLATLTLIPALLSLLGDRIDWPRRRQGVRSQESGVRNETAPITHHPSPITHTGFWPRIARVVMARPVVSLAVGVTLLVAAALPYVDKEDGALGVSSLPADSDARAGFTILEREFAAGLIAPVEIVVDGDAGDPAIQGAIQQLSASLAEDGSYGSPAVTSNDTSDLTLVSVPLTVPPDDQPAYDAIERLRGSLIPTAFAGTPAEVYVAGQTAETVDLFDVINDAAPRVIAFVLGLSFLLLLVAFRSLIVPIKAIVMNLLSVGAAYGLIVLVFQKGYAADFLGFQQTPAIETWIPTFLFAVLFGLSMDYHVFLLSRIQERYHQTGQNREAVAFGLGSTARLITGAAAIMVAVFGGFAAGRLVPLQQVGFGLAVAIFLDATVVRSILVPSTMVLLDKWNWYLPRWLDWLPDLRVEPIAPVPAPAPAPAPVSGDD
ncbi:MAG: MMPL family transporter [Thermomicrobiales bacterium]